MFERSDELMTRFQIYEVYTNNDFDTCFEKLSQFYKEIDEMELMNHLEEAKQPYEEKKESEAHMQPQDVLDLFNSFAA
jgi:hypothetical protein